MRKIFQNTPFYDIIKIERQTQTDVLKMSFDKIIYRLTDKRIPAVTGIGLVGDILERADFQSRFSNIESSGKRSKKQIDTGVIMMTQHRTFVYGKA